MTERRRVVVTGMGLVTALGNDVPTTWAGAGGRSLGDPDDRGLRPVPPGLADRRARCATSTPSGVLDRKEIRRTDRYTQFGLVATAEALVQAGLPERFEGDLAERTGVILGTGLGGVGTLVEGFATNVLRGPDRISPFLVPMAIPNVGAGQVAIRFGMTGPNFTTASACATGGHALGEASEIIRRGDADVMVAGGAEAAIFEPMVGSVRRDARPLDAQRRSGRFVPAVRYRAATGS